jgi:hypothetical protein
MSFTKGDGNLLQIDERGHVRVSRERREALLEEFERSGMSGAKFARLAGIKYPTFMYWLKQRRERCPSQDGGGLSEAATVSFVETHPDEACRRGSAEGLTIELAGGARLRVESPIQLRLGKSVWRMPLD